ncbi:hypothetical protein [Clostridium felsineum]|uniref:hypothetical protein n=1 Tax=Clostridium felsineum TaxID=36839 RepID=UPI00098C01B2|nr:hypothetical protein [Clostridium felsineum]URZ03710.1 hypothetical protein CLAUR_037710 [Clostridium felsineum]
MYLRFKELGVFKELKKKKPHNYTDVPNKFKSWKKKMGYTNAQCAEILNVSIATIKRLASGKIKPFATLYKRLKELKII